VSKTIEKDTLAGEKYDEVHEIQGRLVLLTPGGHEIFRYVIKGPPWSHHGETWRRLGRRFSPFGREGGH
jgi:hypothetical protein